MKTNNKIDMNEFEKLMYKLQYKFDKILNKYDDKSMGLADLMVTIFDYCCQSFQFLNEELTELSKDFPENELESKTILVRNISKLIEQYILDNLDKDRIIN